MRVSQHLKQALALGNRQRKKSSEPAPCRTYGQKEDQTPPRPWSPFRSLWRVVFQVHNTDRQGCEAFRVFQIFEKGPFSNSWFSHTERAGKEHATIGLSPHPSTLHPQNLHKRSLKTCRLQRLARSRDTATPKTEYPRALLEGTVQASEWV